MTNIDRKLERGATLLAEAHGDQDLLGVALLAFQGALDSRLRETLETNPALTAEDRVQMADTALPIQQLVDLARRYGDLNREQAWRILEAERLRVAFSSGEPFRGSPSEIHSYGRFAAEICGNTQLAADLASIPTSKHAIDQATDVVDEEDEDPPPTGVYYTLMRWVPGMLLVAALAIGTWALLGRVTPGSQGDSAPVQITPDLADAPNPSKALPVSPDATLAPVIIGQADPTAAPSPTAAASQGRIVRLAGGPGWLHEAARFDSPTLPIRLSEGQIVTILEQQQTDADGTAWIYVAIGGYEGWSPLNNIERLP